MKSDAIAFFKNSLENKRLALVLGPLFSEANGYKNLKEWLHEKILQYPSATSANQAKQWSADGELPRLWKWCADTENIIEGQGSFEKKISRAFGKVNRPESLYVLADFLQPTVILSTCLDPVLQNLSSQIDSLCANQDDNVRTALTHLKDGRRHLVSIFGRADKPDTVALHFDKYQNLLRSSVWGEYFSALCATRDLLLIGFDPADFFFKYLLRKLRSRSNQPQSAHFFPHSKIEGQWNYPEPKLIDLDSYASLVKSGTPSFEPASFDDSVPGIEASRSLVQTFLGNLVEAARPEWSAEQVTSVIEGTRHIFTELSTISKNQESERSAEAFFHGEEIQWRELDAGLDAPRAKALELKERLRWQGFVVVSGVAPIKPDTLRLMTGG